MPFPSQVNVVPALGVAGDFASHNPRTTVVNQQGAFVAGTSGVAVGLFAWADTTYNRSVSNTGAGAPTGFVARAQQALITTFLADNTQVIPAGLPVTLFSAGEFFVKNSGANAVTIGQIAYANNATGAVTFGSAGSPPTSASVTASIAVNSGSTSTIAVNSFTGSISGNTLTVTAVSTGGIFVGQTLSGGTAVTGYIDPATAITGFVSGTNGGIGVYTLSVNNNIVTSTTITGSGGLLTVGGTVTGTFVPGQTLTGTGVTAGTTILANVSGTGGAGTYGVSVAQTTASTAITASGGTLTVTAVGSGALYVNDTITGSGVTAGTYIASQFSGTTGGVGVYLVSVGQTVASETITVVAGTQTKWVALSTANAGELVKMSSWVLG